MKIPNPKNTILSEPELNWGVKQEKATFKKHLPKRLGVAVSSAFIISGLLLLNTVDRTSNSLYLQLAVVFILLVVGTVALILLLTEYNVNKPLCEKARTLGQTKQTEWEQNHLSPYLAERYNLELIRVNYTENEVIVRQGDEEFPVQLTGIEFSRNDELNWGYFGRNALIYNVKITSEKIGVKRSVIQTLEEIY